MCLLTRTQEVRVEKDHTNIVFPNDSSSIGCRLQKVHDKPCCDRLIHACSCTGGRLRRDRVGKSLPLTDDTYKAVSLLLSVPEHPCDNDTVESDLTM